MRTSSIHWLAVLLVQLDLGPAAATQPRGATPDFSWVPIVEPLDDDVPEPPGGNWLADSDGRQYTLFRWAKRPGEYRLDDDGRFVTLRHGVRFIVEHQDDRHLYLRWYRTAPIVGEIAAGGAGPVDAPHRDPQTQRNELPSADRWWLEPWDAGLPRTGQWRNGFAVADFDGDGHLDLAHGPPRKGALTEPVVFLGDGAGHWTRWADARFPPLPYDYGDVAAGDLDGDGHMDLVVAAHNRGLFALHGDGKGRFASRSKGLPMRARPGATTATARAHGEDPRHPRPPSFTSRAIALADWDRDGRLDLLALAEGPTAPPKVAGAEPSLGKLIFLNRGSAGWQELRGPGALLGDALLPVDLDLDGRLDFVTDSRVVGSLELLNYGTPDGGWTAAALPEPLSGRDVRTQAVAVADFDRDGQPDLALASRSRIGSTAWRGLDVLFGSSGRHWRRVPVWSGPDPGDSSEITALAAGDLDGDGDDDLVALAADGATRLLINAGRGDFTLELSPEAEPGPDHRHCAGYSAAIVDLDRDRRGELVTAFAGEPGSEAMLLGAMPSRCRARGALRVWKLAHPGPARPQ